MADKHPRNDHRKPNQSCWDVSKGRCRWCGDYIRHPDGRLNLRRHWHPHCVDAYKTAAWPGYTRQKVYKRDKGRCAACSKVSRKNWEVDHKVPLIDGGTFDLQNLQTLCPGCHRVKTSQEATERSVRKKTPAERLPEMTQPEVSTESEMPSWEPDLEDPDFEIC